ncbi:molybdopterin-dependent oxidoreductase [Chloroflexota bacterium]
MGKVNKKVNKGVEVKKAVCVWCKGECGVLVSVNDGHLVKVEEDPEWPRKVWPPTKACIRMQHAAEYFYHPNRVNFPLKRVGDRGEGKWQQVTWDQALDEIAEKLQAVIQKYGGEGVCWTYGTGYRNEAPQTARFFRVLDIPNTAAQYVICFGPRCRIADAITGWFPAFSVRPETKCMVFLGSEPLIARPIISNTIFKAKDNGAKIIVIDPRRTRSASTADVWLAPRPGTDAALLLGMINVIVNEELYDKQFVEKWCYGFDKLKERLKEYPLEKVESITGVPAEKIKEAARVYAQNRPGCFVEGMGVEELSNNAQILHCRWILAALAGNIDVNGGEEQAGPMPKLRTFRTAEPPVKFSPGQLEKQVGMDRFKLFGWDGVKAISGENFEKVWKKLPEVLILGHAPMIYRAMITGKPYPIRAAFTSASNPMVTQANTKLVYKALKSLDLYVVSDFFMTPSAELADYVLPVACWLERPLMWEYLGYCEYLITGEAALPAAIPGEYEHKDDYDIWRELAIRLGKGDCFPWRTMEEYYDYLIEPLGYTHNEFVRKVRAYRKPYTEKKYEQQGFATPTGKVELYSKVFEQLGYDPLPYYKEPFETTVSKPEVAKEYPLTLITGGRMREYFHSEWRQIDSIRKVRPYPLLQIHPDTANELAIKNGDWVWIETPRGRVKHKAELFDGIDPNIVHAEHGWWLPELPGEEPWLHGVWEVNINVVTEDDPDVCNEILGTWPLRTALCKVYKVKEY